MKAKMEEEKVDLARFYFVSISDCKEVYMYVLHGHNKSFRIKAEAYADKGGIRNYVMSEYGIVNFRTFEVKGFQDVFIVLVESGWPKYKGEDTCLIKLSKVVPKEVATTDLFLHKRPASRHAAIWETIDLIQEQIKKELAR